MLVEKFEDLVIEPFGMLVCLVQTRVNLEGSKVYQRSGQQEILENVFPMKTDTSDSHTEMITFTCFHVQEPCQDMNVKNRLQSG